MRHAGDRVSWSRFSAIVVALSFIWALDHPVRADLFVSDHQLSSSDTTQFQVLKFNDAGSPLLPNPFIGSIPNRGEGVAYGTISGVPTLFVADTFGNINKYNPTTGGPMGLKPFVALPAAAGGISLSSDGSTLYAAVQAGSIAQIQAFNTSTGAAATPLCPQTPRTTSPITVGWFIQRTPLVLLEQQILMEHQRHPAQA